MSKPFRPMLASTFELGTPITGSMLVSRKLDGIRCIILDGKAVSRSLKPISNKRLRELLSNPILDGLDGELISGEATSNSAFNSTARGVMTHEGGIDDLAFHVFDHCGFPAHPFSQRLSYAAERVQAAQDAGLPVRLVEHTLIDTESKLVEVYQRYLEEGYEGAMIRLPHGPYKEGRSTAREGFLAKLKPFRDSDAIITGFEELERNTNEAKTNLLGHTERSTAQAGKVLAGTLGSLRVKDLTTQIEFKVGGGFTAADRDLLWSQRESLIGRVITYKSCMIGVVDAPRFPVFIRFREDIAA